MPTDFIRPRQVRYSLVASCLLAASLDLYAQTLTNAQRDAEEQRRIQERETQLREQQERGRDVRTDAQSPSAQRLPDIESPCFPIRQLELRGEDAGRFGWVLDSLSGTQKADSPLRKCLGTQGIGILLERAQNALVAKGFVTTRVLTEPQDLSTGSLMLTVVPGRVRAVRFADKDGQTTTASTSLATAVPAQPGDILNLRDIEQALENLKRVPTADADIQIVPADQPDHSDLVIAYQRTTPARLSLALDDSGGKSTGRYQTSATFSWDNPLGLNDLFYVSQNHDAGGGDPGPRGTQGYTVHYSVPYGYWTLGATLSESRYHQTVTGSTQNYVYSGTSGNTEIKASHLFYRDATRKSTVHLKAFERHSNNYVDDTEVQIQRRVVGGWEMGLGHKEFLGSATVDANLAYKRGTRDFAALDAPEESTGQGTARFNLWVADVTLNQPFKLLTQSLRYQATLRVQGNETPLTPQDRFSIGGRYTVRGFDGESSLTGDNGWLLSQDLAWSLGGSGQELYIGIDAGGVNGQSAEQLAGKALSGGVIGLRGNFRKLQYDVFVGAPLYQPSGFRTAETSAGFNMSLAF
ncbi:ShlB/FhaC/HecB family hemolysin secretion/activation protein [Rhodoferax mekongensis]|uniref:ShlB/FhaC/HecB family hemolysin secretion/activation protein n=1 Tax=Rhodoferax mekongensis TaxID=3068341 RepID=A0ABZ0AXP4_9BURK|nr:ShlB/FhaC/HecB family hemolysin secretion/activation protein [Rhodoferax sp. TBRC 17307]WNO04239.1 ShlB/FhaC/HecB family hemolysin secretion/activation protein [Rhodoferax sp. TBRC 17307]